MFVIRRGLLGRSCDTKAIISFGARLMAVVLVLTTRQSSHSTSPLMSVKAIGIHRNKTITWSHQRPHFCPPGWTIEAALSSSKQRTTNNRSLAYGDSLCLLLLTHMTWRTNKQHRMIRSRRPTDCSCIRQHVLFSGLSGMVEVSWSFLSLKEDMTEKKKEDGCW